MTALLVERVGDSPRSRPSGPRRTLPGVAGERLDERVASARSRRDGDRRIRTGSAAAGARSARRPARRVARLGGRGLGAPAAARRWRRRGGGSGPRRGGSAASATRSLAAARPRAAAARRRRRRASPLTPLALSDSRPARSARRAAPRAAGGAARARARPGRRRGTGRSAAGIVVVRSCPRSRVRASERAGRISSRWAAASESSAARGARAGGSARHPRRQALVVGLDRDVDTARRARSANARAAAACAPSLAVERRPGRPTTTSSTLVLGDERARPRRGSGGSITSSGRDDRPARVGDRAAAAGGAVVDGEDPHRGREAYASAVRVARARGRRERLVELLRIAAAGLGDVGSRPPPPPPTTAAASRTTSAAESPRSTAARAEASRPARPCSPALPPSTTAASPSSRCDAGRRASSRPRWSARSPSATTTLIPPTTSTASARARSRALRRPPRAPARRPRASSSASRSAARSGRARPGRAASRAARRPRSSCVAALAEPVDRGRAGERLDPAHVRGARALGDDREDADLGGVGDVGAAAELARDLLDLDHPDPVAVLLAEQRHRAERARPRRAPSPARAPGGSP